MRTHALRFAFIALFSCFTCLLPANMLLQDQYFGNSHAYSVRTEQKKPSLGKNKVLHSLKAIKQFRAWKRQQEYSRQAPNDNRALEKHALYGFGCTVVGISAIVYIAAVGIVTGEGFYINLFLTLFGFYALMIAGVVLGIIGLTKMKKQPNTFRNRWQAVTAIILGALSTTYIGLLALLITSIVIWSKSDTKPQKTN
jgi:hypothetical protein